MQRTLFLLVGSLFLTNFVSALPPRQHLAEGTIETIDKTRIALALTGAGKDIPATFTVKEGRTRFRENGRKASFERLKIGQLVRIYYRMEMGTWVATEVSWKAAPPPQTDFRTPRSAAPPR